VTGYWLLKSEPDDYSFADLERDERAVWDGVRNPVALAHMRRIQPGDLAFFYHTGSERAIVGVARAESGAYPDPRADDERIVVFELSGRKRLRHPVTLKQIKESGEFRDWELVRIPRLSVMPVSKRLWDRVIAMSRSR
jgi:predicted RNA-binding protein with PUA-like domain